MSVSPRHRFTTLAATTAIVVSLLAGCSDPGCLDNKSSLPLAGFYDYATLQPLTAHNISVGAVGAPEDSLLIDNGSAMSTYLPFNIGENSTVFFIRYLGEGLDDPAMFDTLTFVYERLPYYASEDCGVMYKYDVKEFTSTYHRIDSVSLVRPMIDNLESQSIHLFFADLTPQPRPDDPATGDDSGSDNPEEEDNGDTQL